MREIRWGRITKMGDMLPQDKGAAGGKRAAPEVVSGRPAGQLVLHC